MGGIALPPGAELVDQSSIKLPPGAELVHAGGEDQSGFLDTVKSIAHGGMDILQGAASGLGNTLLHGARAAELASGGPLIRAGLSKLGINAGDPLHDAALEKAIPPVPESFSGKAGHFIEQAGEFMAGGEAAAGLSAGMKLLPRMAAQALAGAGVSGVQTGGDKTAAATAGALGAAGPLVSEALHPLMSAVGRKIQASTIRPRLVDMRNGFKWETVDKLGLTGNLEQSMNQVQDKLTELRNARNALIAPGTANVDLQQALNDAEAELHADVASGKFAGQGAKIKGAFNAMREDIESSLGHAPVDIGIAENVKEHMGTLGAWAYGRTDPDAQITEMVANKLYPKIREGIESAIGPQGAQVKALNKEMSELFPLKNAMIARLPMEERNRMFSLQDMAALVPAAVTGHVSLLGLEALSRAQKSVRFGNWLSRNAGMGGSSGLSPVKAIMQEATQPSQ